MDGNQGCGINGFFPTSVMQGKLSLFVVSQKWVPFLTALLQKKRAGSNMGCPIGKWKHGPTPAVCPSDRLILKPQPNGWRQGILPLYVAGLYLRSPFISSGFHFPEPCQTMGFNSTCFNSTCFTKPNKWKPIRFSPSAPIVQGLGSGDAERGAGSASFAVPHSGLPMRPGGTCVTVFFLLLLFSVVFPCFPRFFW